MISLAQLVLLVVITTLTFLVTFVAIQVVHILHELRLTLRKINHLLDHTQTLSEVKQLLEPTEDESPRRRFFHRSGQMLRPTPS